MENEIIDDDNVDNVVTQKKLKVACYIRVSTADQMDMYWPDLQIGRIINYLKARDGDQSSWQTKFNWNKIKRRTLFL